MSDESPARPVDPDLAASVHPIATAQQNGGVADLKVCPMSDEYRAELRQRLIRAFPGRSVCIVEEDWHNSSGDSTKWSVSVLPGWDGTACSAAYAPTLAEAIAQALKHAETADVLRARLDALQHYAADLKQAGLTDRLGPVWTEVQQLQHELAAMGPQANWIPDPDDDPRD